MPAELTYLLDTLQDPNKSSSVIPLVITLFFLFLISLISLIILISAIRMFGGAFKLPRIRLPRFLSGWGKGWGRGRGGKDKESSEKILYHDMPVTDNSELDRLRKENALLRAENSKLLTRSSGLETHMQGMQKQHKESQQTLTQAHFKVVELQKHGAQLEHTLEEICREIEGLYMKGSDAKGMEVIGDKLEHLLREASLHSAMGNAIHVSEAPQVIAQQAKEIQHLKDLLVAAKQQMVELSRDRK